MREKEKGADSDPTRPVSAVDARRWEPLLSSFGVFGFYIKLLGIPNVSADNHCRNDCTLKHVEKHKAGAVIPRESTYSVGLFGRHGHLPTRENLESKCLL